MRDMCGVTETGIVVCDFGLNGFAPGGLQRSRRSIFTHGTPWNTVKHAHYQWI